MYKMVPEATLVTTVGLRKTMPETLRDLPFHASWMQQLPAVDKLYRLYFLLYPLAVASLDLEEFDLVLSSSSGYAKGVMTGRDAIHVCYCHTPMRWVWNYESYASRESFGLAQRVLLPLLLDGLKRWDMGASRQPDHFVANSRSVAERIYKAYGRHTEIIYPPIEVDRFAPAESHDDYYLVLSRLIGYKRLDLAVEACTRLKRRLIVIGGGPDKRSLEAKAGPTVEFLGRLSDSEVNHYMSHCRALLFPGEEDFGMTPLEAAAAGRPTIAYGAGGALETIVEGESGIFFREQTTESLVDAILRFEARHWDSKKLRIHAEKFDVPTFQRRFLSFLNHIGITELSRTALANR
jgi:glycosyltransferase involved in cell wall biosynthesis